MRYNHNSSFENIAQFAAAVVLAARHGDVDHRLAALSVSDDTVMSSGGYVIPPELKEAVWSLVFNDADLVGLAFSEPTKSSVTRVVKNEATPWGAAGIKASWRLEGQTLGVTELMLKMAQVPLHELYAYTVASSELIEDAPLMSARLTESAAAAIRWKASNAIMWGEGIGRPVGFMNSDALVVVDKEPGQSASTILAENVANMFSRLLPGSVRNARWLVNPEALPQLMTMRIEGQPIWTPPGAGFADAPGGLLLGRPIEITDHAAELGTKGDIVLADMKGYYLPTKASGIDLSSSVHLYFDRGLEAFRWTFRVGGQPLLSEPVKPGRGAKSKSHFIALGERR